ncbi:SAV_6107 family HEPN domain-containing protein [Corynebacterium lubricantis]|uniref:SAV_6107 family HEPN domain-containing protein n=1 Tax=Corynebacterium lubricantis TaxID=541095 RepID=UPI0004761A6A|nr:SAV_6107 family HEPN domain-containing protein [Corynebacterium lubricantis]
MNSVISATTGSVSGAPSRLGKSGNFLATAESLLRSAQVYLEQGKLDLALEYAYRAALRVAGAVNADSPVIKKRKRLPSSAWQRLALTGVSGQKWAAEFEQYSTLRGRVASGIVTSPNREVVERVFSLAAEFYAEVFYGDSLPENGVVSAA